MHDVVDTAVNEAITLSDAGFPALMIENFGDTPFFGESVPAETVSAMTIVARAVADAVMLPLGINVLRNDAASALAIASVTGAAFIRVNVLTGIMYTDQGPLVGKAAELMRRRKSLGSDVEVWADVMVKHATPPEGQSIVQAASDAMERGHADALIVSGAGTGAATEPDDLAAIRSVVPDARIVVGSGATVDNLPALIPPADSVIVGSSIKTDGDARNPVDADAARHFVKIARELGLL